MYFDLLTANLIKTNMVLILKAFDNTLDTDSSAVPIPEVDLYLHLLVLIHFLDSNRLKDAINLTKDIIERLHFYNGSTLDFISAKLWFYIARSYELTNNLISIRPQLLIALRTSTLRHYTETQASLITLLLRNYIATSDYSHASNLVSKASFPEEAGNALVARYYYYLAKIHSIQLDYSTAHEFCIGAIRKAPQSKLTAGFLQAANKLNIVIELLMGDIPELSVFRQPLLEKSLIPYGAVASAVRVGDLNLFSQTLTKYSNLLKKDGTYSLVLRLRQNVIKTGIRIMSLTYSRISLKDICIKLQLESEESAEYIVAKAIRDGVIEATLNHEKGYMQSKEVLDVYSTNEPQQTFHQRIQFCISLHNDSVKAMRYPMSTNRVDLKTDEEIRERENELVNEIQDGDLDGDFF